MLAGFDVAYFMASNDNLETITAFANANDADFPVLSDPLKTAARAYGVLGAAGYPKRWTFYIGGDGRIVDIDTQVNPVTAGQDIVDRLRALGVPQKR